MAGPQGDPDFAVVLHAADARAVPGARVKDDKRAPADSIGVSAGGTMRTSA